MTPQEVSGPPNLRAAASDLVSALRERAPRLAMAVAAGQMAWPLAAQLRNKARERTTYTVKVPGNDDMYDVLHEWVLGLLPPSDQRALVAWSSARGNWDTLVAVDTRERDIEPRIRLRYDGTRQHIITVAGHKVQVSVVDGAGADDEKRQWRPPEIVFTTASLPGRQALLIEMNAVLHRSHQAKRRPAFRMFDNWGNWERLDELPPRDLASVILPPGQLERLTEDVGRFLGAENEYSRRCIPWHRGHLYEGPPGTGKTSVARAVASHFGMDVWYLPLADVKKDGELLRMVSRVAPRSMLLLEDVDVFHAATERDDEAGSVTLSGLLNTLDGIATPHGLLTVLTTNTPEALDPAVVRPGRVDLVEHFSLADAGQVERLVSRYYGRQVSASTGLAGIAPAEVVEACKRNATAAEALADIATVIAVKVCSA